MKEFVLDFPADKNELKTNKLLLDGLNPSQQEAAKTLHGPLMIIAGAGSGKTRTLTYRVANLLATKTCQAYQILSLTFTNKAAREMQNRIIELVGEDAARGIWMGTFHSVFARLLRIEAEAIGYTKNYTIYDSDDSERVVKSLMAQYGIGDSQVKPRAIKNAISKAKNNLLSPSQFENSSSSLQEIQAAKIYRPYENSLKRSNAMDFDDLLIKPIQLLEQNPEILAKYQRRWRFIHIDEYQDTNKAQYKLANMLAAKEKNLCVVGDDAQSIYAFRGADIRNILDFKKDYPAVKTVRLEQNYRSTKNILQLADSVIKVNQGQIKKKLWTDNEEGEKVVVLEARSERDEGMKIERYVRDLNVRQGIPYGEFSILYRTNAQSRALEDSLRRASIPYVIIGGVNFYQRKEIKDALAYLKVLVNPADEQSLNRIINYPVRGIGNKTIQRIREYSSRKDQSMWQSVLDLESVQLDGRATKAVFAFRQLILQFGEKVYSLPADELAREVVRESGILKLLRQENTIESLNRWENVQELISGIAEYSSQNPEATLADFLQEVSLLTDQDKKSNNRDRVSLMTLHASKGLEFDVVFLCGLEDGLFPLASVTKTQSELEEERRLLYVGITRARKQLFLSYALSRFRYGEYVESEVSQFMDDMDPKVMISEIGRPYEKGYSSANSGRITGGSSTGRKTGLKQKTNYNRSFTGSTGGKINTGGNREPGSSMSEIVAGVRVKHHLFGQGKVLSVEPDGDKTRAVVFFKGVGQKKLVLKYARLKKID